jgi:Flp pilus assembly protein TadG
MGTFNHRKSQKARSILSRTSWTSRFGWMKGQSMVEFAIVAPIFLLLVFAVMEYGRIFFVQMNVQQAVHDAGRFASTGNHLSDPNNPGSNLSRVQSIIQTIQNEAVAVPGVNPSDLKISSVNGGAGSAGGPSDVVTVSLTTNLPLATPLIGLLFPNGAYTFVASATFKNEPFDPANTK